MNTAVYRHLLNNYGRSPAVWFGMFTELVRSLMLRVWIGVIMAQTAAHLATGDVASARRSILNFLLIYIIGSIIGAIGELVSLRSENKQYGTLMVGFHRKLTGKDMSFYRDNHGGYLVSMFRQYLDGMLQLMRFIRGDAIRSFVSLVAPVAVLIWMDWKLGLVAAGIIAVQLTYIIWSSAKANKYREISHEVYREITGEVADEITNITAFKSSGVEERAHENIVQLSIEEVSAFWQRHRLSTLMNLPRELITAGGIAGAFYIILANSSGGSKSVELIVLALTYIFQIIRSISDLPNQIAVHDEYITKVFPALKYLGDSYETIKDPVNPKKLQLSSATIDITNVDFGYPAHTGDKNLIPVFKNLSIHINGGEQIGIIGLSGAGKSTLASLLMRFDDVNAGSITIDGIDIREILQSYLHQHIAYVPQEPLLFHKSIKENIAYYDMQANSEAIIQAAKAAHAHDFISCLPDGYDSMVGERGIKLSGGQKQRIVIARAILKKAPIMIFDEATSALDTESEKIIQNALPEILGKQTAIVIAHRLSTIADLDRILVMHDGQIIENGTHDELLVLRGRYFSLWQKQIANKEPLQS